MSKDDNQKDEVRMVGVTRISTASSLQSGCQASLVGFRQCDYASAVVIHC